MIYNFYNTLVNFIDPKYLGSRIMPLSVRCHLYSIGHAGLSPAFLLDFQANHHVVKLCQDRFPLKFKAVMKLYAYFEYIYLNTSMVFISYVVEYYL